MSIPEPSKLNWSTRKPTFEEVRDKRVHIEYRDGHHVTENISDAKIYEIYFLYYSTSFQRYAILDIEESPLEFCGMKVHVVQNTPNSFQWAFATKEDCERAWNEFIRRLK